MELEERGSIKEDNEKKMDIDWPCLTLAVSRLCFRLASYLSLTHVPTRHPTRLRLRLPTFSHTSTHRLMQRPIDLPAR